MQNRRLIYIPTEPSLKNLASIMNAIDHYILESKYLSRLNPNYCFYGKANSVQEVWCGREIAGREEDIYSHPEIKVVDFEAGDFENLKVTATNFQELFSTIENMNSKYDSFRVLYSLETPMDFDLFLF